MIKCVEHYSGKQIGELDKMPEGEFEFISKDDYTYIFRYGVNNVAFFDLQRTNRQIENNFSYHAPKDGQPEKYTQIRKTAKELAYLIDDLVPNSREKSSAMTKLEEAVFWANAGIARNE